MNNNVDEYVKCMHTSAATGDDCRIFSQSRSHDVLIIAFYFESKIYTFELTIASNLVFILKPLLGTLAVFNPQENVIIKLLSISSSSSPFSFKSFLSLMRDKLLGKFFNKESLPFRSTSIFGQCKNEMSSQASLDAIVNKLSGSSNSVFLINNYLYNSKTTIIDNLRYINCYKEKNNDLKGNFLNSNQFYWVVDMDEFDYLNVRKRLILKFKSNHIDSFDLEVVRFNNYFENQFVEESENLTYFNTLYDEFKIIQLIKQHTIKINLKNIETVCSPYHPAFNVFDNENIFSKYLMTYINNNCLLVSA